MWKLDTLLDCYRGTSSLVFCFFILFVVQLVREIEFELPGYRFLPRPANVLCSERRSSSGCVFWLLKNVFICIVSSILRFYFFLPLFKQRMRVVCCLGILSLLLIFKLPYRLFINSPCRFEVRQLSGFVCVESKRVCRQANRFVYTQVSVASVLMECVFNWLKNIWVN